MRRTDLLDTSEWAHRIMIERLRAMTPAERLRITFEMCELGREVRKSAVAEGRIAYEKRP